MFCSAILLPEPTFNFSIANWMFSFVLRRPFFHFIDILSIRFGRNGWNEKTKIVLVFKRSSGSTTSNSSLSLAFFFSVFLHSLTVSISEIIAAIKTVFGLDVRLYLTKWYIANALLQMCEVGFSRIRVTWSLLRHYLPDSDEKNNYKQKANKPTEPKTTYARLFSLVVFSFVVVVLLRALLYTQHKFYLISVLDS